jgi:hypothetical protein
VLALTAEWQRVRQPTSPAPGSGERREVLARGVSPLGSEPATPAFLDIEAGDTTIIEGARARAGMEPAAEVLIELELS